MSLPPPRDISRVWGGARGITPSASDSRSYLEISCCGDDIIRCSIHVYLDPIGVLLPRRRKVINGIPQTDRNGDPSFWPDQRLLGRTSIIDSLQTVTLLSPSGRCPLSHHIGGYAQITTSPRTLEDALDYYRRRDSHGSSPLRAFSPPDNDLEPEGHEDPPFIPSTASVAGRGSLPAHNLPPTPHQEIA